MAIMTWDGDISSVCEKVGLLGGWRTTGNCANWSAEPKADDVPIGRLVWAQSEAAAFAKSYMPAVQLSSGATESRTEPRYYLFSGSQAASVDLGSGRRLELAPTQVVLLRMDDPLRWAIEKPYVANSLIVGESMLRAACRSYERLLGRRLGFPYRLERPLHELLVVAQRALESDSFGGAGDDLAHAILKILSLADPDLQPDYTADFGTEGDVRCEQIRSFIDQNFRAPDMGVGRIADRFKISSRYIQMILAKNGLTASELIRTKRVQEAGRMLQDRRNQHLSITEIAFDCGFNSSAYFSTEFRRAYDVSPRKYRMTQS